MGSPSYIAPELMVDGARYDEKADVYSFGILMWFVCQHVHLMYNPDLWATKRDFANLMRPYTNGKAPDWVVRPLEFSH